MFGHVCEWSLAATKRTVGTDGVEVAKSAKPTSQAAGSADVGGLRLSANDAMEPAYLWRPFC